MYRIRLCIFLFLLLPYNVTAESPSPKAETGEKRLRFGVLSLSHPLVMYRQYLPFTDFLAERLAVRVDLILAKNYESIVQFLLDDKIQLALLAGVSYIDVNESGKVVPLCSVLGANGTPTSRSTFIVRDSREDISSLQDLKGKSFAFGSTGSASSYLQPLGFLYSKGIRPADFSNSQNLATQDAVVRSVLRGTHDGGSVSESTLERYPDVGLKRISQTVAYPGFVIVASHRVPMEIQEQIRTLLLTLDYTNPAVSKVAVRWSPLLQHGFVPTPPGAYDSVRDLMKTLQQAGVYR